MQLRQTIRVAKLHKTFQVLYLPTNLGQQKENPPQNILLTFNGVTGNRFVSICSPDRLIWLITNIKASSLKLYDVSLFQLFKARIT